MFRSRPYLSFVRGQVCGAPSCMDKAEHAHHFARSAGGGGTALKPHDTFTVPLCAHHHAEVHMYGGLEVFGRDSSITEGHFYRIALRLITEFLGRKAA